MSASGESREPAAYFIRLAATRYRHEGLGLTTSTLHDERGPVGVAAQQLTIRPRG